MRIQALKTSLITYSRYLITAVAFVIAILIIGWLWNYYQYDPWTRDSRLRADVVNVAPDVPGLVAAVYVKDNQFVHRGQKLFMIDQQRFILALEEAKAKVINDQATLLENKREDARNIKLGNLVSKEQREQSLARTEEYQAALNQAIASFNTARLNLIRSVVIAPVNGFITNFDLQPGNYVTTGESVFAMIDSDTLRLEGYFEETKLSHIHIGDRAIIHLMGENTNICGHVESIAAGIEDRERTPTQSQLANINPTFNWVRLAQRVPVRIKLDYAPQSIRLVAGRTATVTILERSKSRAGQPC